jgi:hypothetical protein
MDEMEISLPSLITWAALYNLRILKWIGIWASFLSVARRSLSKDGWESRLKNYCPEWK